MFNLNGGDLSCTIAVNNIDTLFVQYFRGRCFPVLQSPNCNNIAFDISVQMDIFEGKVFPCYRAAIVSTYIPATLIAGSQTNKGKFICLLWCIG